MKIFIANRILSGFSAILSLTLLLTCVWMHTSLLVKKSSNDSEKCSLKYHPLLCNDKEESSSQAPSFEDEHGAVVIPNDEVNKKQSWRASKIWTEYNEMTPRFRVVIISCLSGVIVGSLVQFICALVLLFTPDYKVPTRSRRMVYVLFGVFIIFLVGFAFPLAFKRKRDPHDEEEDEMHTLSTLSTALMNFMSTFNWDKLFKDLSLYYIGLFSDIIYLFLNMVVSCCLLRFTEYEEYDI